MRKGTGVLLLNKNVCRLWDKWTGMASLPIPMENFEMVAINDHVYTLGGCHFFRIFLRLCTFLFSFECYTKTFFVSFLEQTPHPKMQIVTLFSPNNPSPPSRPKTQWYSLPIFRLSLGKPFSFSSSGPDKPPGFAGRKQGICSQMFFVMHSECK
jgi:hypothetical protein